MNLKLTPMPQDPFFAPYEEQMSVMKVDTEDIMLHRAREIEARVKGFIERTGLPKEEVILIRFPNGSLEPMWKRLLQVIPVGQPSEEDECQL